MTLTRCNHCVTPDGLCALMTHEEPNNEIYCGVLIRKDCNFFSYSNSWETWRKHCVQKSAHQLCRKRTIERMNPKYCNGEETCEDYEEGEH